MIKLKLTTLEETAKQRPEGYLQTVMDAGRIEAGFLWLSDEAYAALRARYGGAGTPVAPLAKTRFEICKVCDKSNNNGFGCAHYQSCCFGRWRSQPENKCYEGKW